MAANPIPLPEEPAAGPLPLLEAKVARVTLLEDRAQVRREGRARLPAGDHRLRVAGVSPVMSDRSVVARADAGCKVREARVVRRWRIGAAERPGEAAKLAEETSKLVAEINRAHQAHQLLLEQRGAAEQAAGLLVDGINRELPFAKEEMPPSWPNDLEELQGRARALDEEIRKSELGLRELQGRLAALQARAWTTGRPDHILSTDLEVEVTVTEAGEHALTIDYLVPCALWRPIHRATLKEGGIRFECEGAVWQATGEDWVDAALSFSTARPTQRSEPPVLADDVLQVKPRAEKKVEVAIREEVIEDTGEGGARESGEVPGVDDGGETRLLGAATRATIPSDGRLYRVPIFTFEAKAELERVARPELSRLVHLRSKQGNPGKEPILAGPVELLRGSGYVGRGMVEFVAPGEAFTLGWGGEESLRVRRSDWEHRETGKLTGKQTITRTVELHLSNLDDAPASFRVEERIPVSEIASVEVVVDAKETAPAATPDRQGIVAWPVTLMAHGTAKIRLVYRLIASSDVKGL